MALAVGYRSTEIKYAIWAGDFFDRESLTSEGFQLELGDFTAGPDGRIIVPDGTVLGRTFAERDAGSGFGPADFVGDEEIYLLASTIEDGNQFPGCTFYRHGRKVYEDRLENFAGRPAAEQTWIRDNYQCTISEYTVF